MIIFSPSRHAELSSLLSQVVPAEHVEDACELFLFILEPDADAAAIDTALHTIRAQYAPPVETGIYIQRVEIAGEERWDIRCAANILRGRERSRDDAVAAACAQSWFGTGAA
jgi:hypothetical protein